MNALEWLRFLEEIADRTDPLALARFRAGDLRIDTKPDRSLVTEADLAIETCARERVQCRFPELSVYGEEHGQQVDRGSGCLLIDPIDATANFARGIPIFATLLAIEIEAEIVAGLVSAPALGTRWTAARGAGARRNGTEVSVSGIRTLEHAQAFYGSLAGPELIRPVPGQRALLESTERQRGFGDFYQHVLVAEGAGELALDPEVHPWDIAPLLIIAEEAGGRATALDGTRTIYGGSLVTTNRLLHPIVLAALQGLPAADATAGAPAAARPPVP